MNVKKINQIFAYALFIVGALKILLIILVLTKITSNLNAIYAGGEADLNYYTAFSTTIGFSQLILAVGAIIMIILNIKIQPKVISGYLWSLGALLIELIIPSIFSVYTAFVSASMYIKSGVAIKNKNLGYDKNYKKMVKSTEWFYADEEKK